MEGINLRTLELVSSVVPLKTWAMMNELKNAAKETESMYQKTKEMEEDEKKKDIEEFYFDEEAGLKHGVKAVMELCKLMQFCVIDIHTIKNKIKEYLDDDQIAEKLGFPVEVDEKLKGDVAKTLEQINSYLKKEADIVEALTRK